MLFTPRGVTANGVDDSDNLFNGQIALALHYTTGIKRPFEHRARATYTKGALQGRREMMPSSHND